MPHQSDIRMPVKASRKRHKGKTTGLKLADTQLVCYAVFILVNSGREDSPVLL